MRGTVFAIVMYINKCKMCLFLIKGGIVSLEDLRMYNSSWKAPEKVVLSNGNYTFYNPPPPSSGVVLSFIAGILNGNILIFFPLISYRAVPYLVQLFHLVQIFAHSRF